MKEAEREIIFSTSEQSGRTEGGPGKRGRTAGGGGLRGGGLHPSAALVRVWTTLTLNGPTSDSDQRAGTPCTLLPLLPCVHGESHFAPNPRLPPMHGWEMSASSPLTRIRGSPRMSHLFPFFLLFSPSLFFLVSTRTLPPPRGWETSGHIWMLWCFLSLLR